MTYRFLIHYADGDDFTKRYRSHVEVLATNALDARLLAEQMAYTPQPGKPAHIQIMGAR